MFDARFTPIEAPFVTVRAILTDGNGNGRYEIKTRNGKNYRAIICDRLVRDVWVVKPARSLQRGKPAWEFVVKQLREFGHIN